MTAGLPDNLFLQDPIPFFDIPVVDVRAVNPAMALYPWQPIWEFYWATGADFQRLVEHSLAPEQLTLLSFNDVPQAAISASQATLEDTAAPYVVTDYAGMFLTAYHSDFAIVSLPPAAFEAFFGFKPTEAAAAFHESMLYEDYVDYARCTLEIRDVLTKLNLER